MSLNSSALRANDASSALERGQQRVRRLVERGEVHGAREDVVGRLAHVHVVVGVRALAGEVRDAPRWRSCSTTCPSRSGRRRSGTGRRARRRRPRRPPAAMRSATSRVEQPELGVHARRGALDPPEPAHDRDRHALARDREVLDRLRGLAAPQLLRSSPSLSPPVHRCSRAWTRMLPAIDIDHGCLLTRRDLLRAGALAARRARARPRRSGARRRRRRRRRRPAPGPYGPLGAADANGLCCPPGFTSRVIARGGELVAGHGLPLARLPRRPGRRTRPPDGGWILVDELRGAAAGGGASPIRFDRDGTITDARTGSSPGRRSNCAGGPTPWGTWMSCEEHDERPRVGVRPDGATPGGARARRWARSSTRRSRVDPSASGSTSPRTRPTAASTASRRRLSGPDAGLLEVAVVAADGGVTWAPVPSPYAAPPHPTRKQVPAMTRFKRGEGICFDSGVVYVATTSDSKSTPTTASRRDHGHLRRRGAHRPAADQPGQHRRLRRLGRPLRLRGRRRRRPARPLPDHARGRGRRGSSS